MSEVLTAVMILSVLSVLLVGVIPATVLGLRAAGQRMGASQLARNQIEQLRQLGLDQLRNAPLEPCIQNGTEYSGQIEVGTALDSESRAMDARRGRLVTITIHWKGRGGSAQSYRAQAVLVRQL